MGTDIPKPILYRLTGVGLTLAAFILYFFTLAPTVLEADAGEFQFVPWLPGIAHPTGYPLYVLLGWVWTRILSVGEVAWRMNLLSAFLGALAVGATYAVTHRLAELAYAAEPAPARTLTAALAAATFAVTPTFWGQAIIAEVYALHALFVAAVLGLTLNVRRVEPGRAFRAGILLAFVFGLGLTHHSTTVLLLPGMALYLWSTRPSKTSVEKRARMWPFFVLAALAPLLLYLSLPLIAPSTPYATLTLSDSQTLVLYENSFRGFVQHITGAVFASELQPAAIGVQRFLLPFQLLWQQIGWAGIALACLGVAALGQRRQFGVLLLTGVSALTLVVFNLIYFIGDVFVLFIPVWLIVCMWLGMGALALGRRMTQGFVRRKMGPKEGVALASMWEQLNTRMYQLTLIMGLLFFFALPITLWITTMPTVNQRHNTTAREQWLKILREPLPDSAILVSNDRNEMMPLWYYQYVEQIRPDLTGLFPLIVTDPAYANVGRVLEQALLSSRPVYLIKAMDGLEVKAGLKPEGALFRAMPYPTPLPANPQAVTWPEIILSGYDLSPDQPTPGHTINLTLYWQPTQKLAVDYTSYVHIISADGRRIAQSDHQPGGNYYPTRYWQPGETLRDQHTLTLPEETPPGLYHLRIGMYHQPEPGVIINMGNQADIGQIMVGDCC